MDKQESRELPSSDDSMAFSVCRFETISCAIYATFLALDAREPGRFRLSVSRDAYRHFRNRAYKLLAHYIDVGLHDAFHWSLAMRGAAPKRKRGSIAENHFYWGLLAMSGAAGNFMSRNKLRDLSKRMSRAHDSGINRSELERFIRHDKFEAVDRAIARRRAATVAEGHQGT